MDARQNYNIDYNCHSAPDIVVTGCIVTDVLVNTSLKAAYKSTARRLV